MKTLTVEQVAAREVLSVQRIRQLCKAGKIVGATKQGRDWVIVASYEVIRTQPGRPAGSRGRGAGKIEPG